MVKWNRVLVIVIILAQLYLGLSLKFPPTLEQLSIIGRFYRSGDGTVWLYGLRLLTLVILIFGIRIWIKKINKIFGNNIGSVSALLIIISPVFFGWWYLYPISAIKLIAVFLPLLLLSKQVKVGLGLTILLMLFFSLMESKDRAAIFHKISLSDATKETTERFTREDSLADRLIFSLIWRRVGYNKIFMTYKEVVGEFIPFFDPETLFFQEVSPTEQKSLVIFYWPEIFLFFWGIYAVTRKKYIKNSKYLLWLLLLSFEYYLFSSKPIYLRMSLVVLPISLIMATGIIRLFFLARKKVIFAKVFLMTVVILIGNGIWANYRDILIRPDFWFDNRPLVYDFLFKNIKTLNAVDFKIIKVTSKMEGGREYCNYYIKECGVKSDLSGFDLKDKMAESQTVYAGFTGEFVGSDYGNNIDKNWRNIIISKGLTIVADEEIRDSVAYRYGNHIVVAIKK